MTYPFNHGHNGNQSFPDQESEVDAVIQNIISIPSRPHASFTWNIHSDKVLIDYCSYFLDPDGSIDNDKWAPLASELGTSASSCRMRWHVLKGTATQETWVQQQQFLRQSLFLSVTEQVQSTNCNPAPPTPQQPHNKEEEEYHDPEFDAYLQRVLWEDEDFVRAVDAIYQEEKEFNNLLESPEHVTMSMKTQTSTASVVGGVGGSSNKELYITDTAFINDSEYEI